MSWRAIARPQKHFYLILAIKVDRQNEKLGDKFNLDSLSISILKNGGPVDETITVNKLDIYTRQ
ncbi:hypothetical protein [Okeania sp. SIO2B3]|uniref:hypothetical protein n=1 Tax=Okeania sp. SIO2B3 TaxID=2607784 RepID=UPI0013C19834|nr:hypothetical protein [Okeania sp. SIO2B3]NET44371.1 hypothetical protein [Okeania sp. SIO2B3]